jgi:hypothetical protein
VEFSRRGFLAELGVALVALQGSELMAAATRASAAATPPSATLEDTINALIAFVVPGRDEFSIAQGERSPYPGGVEAGITNVFIESLNAVSPPPPPFPSVSDAVAAILNLVAAQANPASGGFAGLAFADKISAFEILESDPPAAALTSLPALVAFVAFSEAGVWDPVARSTTSRPIGWDLTGYPGVADGRDELVGYWQDRRRVETLTGLPSQQGAPRA